MSTRYDYTLTLTTVVHSDVPLSDDEARADALPVNDWSEARVQVGVHVSGDDELDQVEQELDGLAHLDNPTAQQKAYAGVEQHMRLKRFHQHLERGYLPCEPDNLTPEQIAALRDRVRGLRRRILIECMNLPADAVDRITERD